MPEDKTTEIDVKKTPASAPPPAPSAGGDIFTTLRTEIDRLFDDVGWSGMPWRRPLRERPSWMPALTGAAAMDLVERDGGYDLSVELPGLAPGDIDVRISDGMLTISGEKSEETKEEKGRYRMQERRYGTVQRSLALPAGIDAARVEARFENGVLKLTLPKTQEARAQERKIEIKAG